MVEVSIIIPVYNAEKYLEECMESICLQTYKNIEIICVDDGSTDKSAEIIKNFQKKDKRIKLIQQENQYAGVARNIGLDMAQGEYVIFLDADDYFEKSLIEKMLNRICEKNADIVICGSRGFDDKLKKQHKLSGALNVNILPEKDVFSIEDIPEYIFQLTAGWAWDKMYRRDFLREKHLQFLTIKAAEDEFFVDLAFCEARAITVVNEILVTHRTNVISSLEYRKDQLWYCGYEMLIAEKEGLKKRKLYQKLKKSFINRAAGYIAWNACSITNPIFFSEFYVYFREKAIEEFGFSHYSLEYYYDPFVYQIIKNLEEYTEKEFLCNRIQYLNEMVKDKEIYMEELLLNVEVLLEQMRWMQKGKRWILPENALLKGSRIILYGFGDVGSDWYKDIQKIKDIKLEMIVDQEYLKYKNKNIIIHPVEDIEKIDYDYILIAINDKSIVDAVKNLLIKRGVSEEKILWFDPEKRKVK